MSGHASPAVRMLQSLYLVIDAREGSFRQLLRLLVLNAPDAAEMMIAIGTNRGVARAMFRSASVIVNGGLVVEINHVKRAIRSDATVNRAEPKIGAGDELGIFAAFFLGREESHAIPFDHVHVH